MTAGAWFVLLGTWLVAVASPGPDFVAVLKTSLARGRAAGTAVAAGIAGGIAVWLVLSLVGVVGLVHAHAGVYTVIRWAGALFLIVYGLQILVGLVRARRAADGAKAKAGAPTAGGTVAGPGVSAVDARGADAEDGERPVNADAAASGASAEPGPAEPVPPVWTAVRLGFLTNTIGNPKAVVFFGALLVTLLPAGISAGESVLVGTAMVVTAFAWFVGVAVIASLGPVVALYRRAEFGIDVSLGVLFVVLGVALLPVVSGS